LSGDEGRKDADEKDLGTHDAFWLDEDWIGLSGVWWTLVDGLRLKFDGLEVFFEDVE
jgi:hypothetical protein